MNTKFLMLLLAPLTMIAVGCSTTGQFRIPANQKLMVTDRTVTPDAEGNWKTSPFFWDQTGGATYMLYDQNGQVVRRGKVKTKFRVASIFWPPAAIIYWPMGFVGGSVYDFTAPADGYMIVDDPTPISNPTVAQPVGSTATNPGAVTPAKPLPKKRKKVATPAVPPVGTPAPTPAK
jgi:hypothetical protein